ncbi:uncharacterized protein LOC135391911 isoform X2 [Ornithodoros turicata]|uniref:uncharacterized protein LOC135391911 isoform X2 n=1 Tax=Ornithodoros turicata TaxID=34597 RepID=UPI003139BED0
MFPVWKGSNNAVQRSRVLGYSAKISNADRTESSHQAAEMSSSRMPYNQMNGRRSHGAQREPQERISPQHEEVVSYLHNSWKHVCNQYEISQQAAYEVQRVVYYRQKEPTVSNSCSSQYVGGL